MSGIPARAFEMLGEQAFFPNERSSVSWLRSTGQAACQNGTRSGGGVMSEPYFFKMVSQVGNLGIQNLEMKKAVRQLPGKRFERI